MKKGLSLSRNMDGYAMSQSTGIPVWTGSTDIRNMTPRRRWLLPKAVISRQLFPLISKGLSGAVYTQLSDVEEEVNGLVTYDRRIVKLPVGHPFAAPSSFAAPYSHGNKPE